MSTKVLQEFYCSGCKAWFDVNLSLALNKHVNVHCPKCGRLHKRHVKYGVIREGGDPSIPYSEKMIDEIFPTLAAWHEKPRTAAMLKAEADGIRKQEHNTTERNGIPVDVERWAELVKSRQQGGG